MKKNQFFDSEVTVPVTSGAVKKQKIIALNSICISVESNYNLC